MKHPAVGDVVIYTGRWARPKGQGWGDVSVRATVMDYQRNKLGTVDTLYIEPPYGTSIMEHHIRFSPVPKYRHWSPLPPD